MAAACGNEPSPDVTGAWTLITSFAGGNLQCTSQGTLTLENTGAGLSGTFVEEAASCTESGTPISLVLSSYTLSGSVEGSSIDFTLQPQDGQQGCAEFRFQGQTAESHLSGAISTQPVFCQGTYTEMSGSWTAEPL